MNIRYLGYFSNKIARWYARLSALRPALPRCVFIFHGKREFVRDVSRVVDLVVKRLLVSDYSNVPLTSGTTRVTVLRDAFSLGGGAMTFRFI